MMNERTRDGRVTYDDHGGAGVALLCLPGWGVNRRFFDSLVERLSPRHRVVVLDWRGHGDSASADQLGHDELVQDALAVIEAAGLDAVVPVAQAHGGWIAIELHRRLGRRIPAIVTMSWLVLDPPGPFLSTLSALKDPSRWQAAREQLFAVWTTGAPAAIVERIRTEMGGYGYDVWSAAADAIAGEYARHGNPLRALAALPSPPRVLHVYSQPTAPEFLAAQEAFAEQHRWFHVRRLAGHGHFPVFDAPDELAREIERFLR